MFQATNLQQPFAFTLAMGAENYVLGTADPANALGPGLATNGGRLLTLKVNNAANGDVVAVRLYGRVTPTDTWSLLDTATVAANANVALPFPLPPLYAVQATLNPVGAYTVAVAAQVGLET